MAYPYKKMTSEDFDYIRSVTASDRVWVGDEIAKEYYRDEYLHPNDCGFNHYITNLKKHITIIADLKND